MNSNDKRLGMDRPIARRDFLSGVGITLGAALLPVDFIGSALSATPSPQCCPAQKLGMRGSHPGSFEVAHATRDGKKWDAQKSDEQYDLIIVGAGISGLSAAYIYHRDVNPKARILILDNHDDFGGHAKRNEFTHDGKTLIGFGGTMLMSSPKTYPAVAKQLVRELGIDTDYDTEFDNSDLFKSLGMSGGTFFDVETFGKDHLSIGNLVSGDALDGAPLSASAKADLKRLFADDQNYLEDKTISERREILKTHSWRDYLKKYADMGEEALKFIQKQPHGVWAIGADAFPALHAWEEDYSGFGDMDLGYEEGETSEGNNGRFRFPDGNASIARLLVRKLIPGIANGDTKEDVVTAKFDYSKLDQPKNLTRIRLNSTAVDLKHSDGNLEAEVEVTYVKGDQARTIKADKVIWAGYHAMLKHICVDVPEEQFDALSSSVRAPLVYLNV